MSTTTNKKIRTMFVMTEELNKALQAEAERRTLSASALVRIAVQQMLRESPQQEQATA